MSNGWIAVDLDGTLAHDIVGEKFDPAVIGPPVHAMVAIVRDHLAHGDEVRIFTARASTIDHHTVFDGSPEEYLAHITDVIQTWCLLHIGVKLPVTCVKDYRMKMLYDDRAVRIRRNEGKRCCE
jgi:hypothetical protein